MIFATTDNRRQISKKRASQNGIDITTHDDSTWMGNEQSFDAFIKNTLGFQEEQMSGATRNNQQQLLSYNRQSFGIGALQRGSADTMFGGKQP